MDIVAALASTRRPREGVSGPAPGEVRVELEPGVTLFARVRAISSADLAEHRVGQLLLARGFEALLSRQPRTDATPPEQARDMVAELERFEAELRKVGAEGVRRSAEQVEAAICAGVVALGAPDAEGVIRWRDVRLVRAESEEALQASPPRLHVSAIPEAARGTIAQAVWDYAGGEGSLAVLRSFCRRPDPASAAPADLPSNGAHPSGGAPNGSP